MTATPKITVIIPTRERCDVLEASLRTVTAQDYDNLEIIVSDNFSEDGTADVVRRTNDGRIKYLNTGKRMSMSHNWEFALSHVQDGWVTFMGDDDGLLPNSIATVMNIIRSTSAKAVRTNFCTYDWPSVKGNAHGELIVPLSSGIEMRKTSHWLPKVMNGYAKYNQLPMIYNGGFIHISILNRIREITGSYFLSSIPDVYSAIAISRITERYAYSSEPLAISGTSKHSNGNSFFSTSKNRDERPRKTFANEGNIPFHSEVPLCADGTYPLSLQVCVYEAYLQSERLGGGVSGVNPSQQLEVIMATAGKHRESIVKWGEIFSEMHKIDFKAAKRATSFKRGLLQSLAMTRKAINAANSVITESLPIKDVYDASIAASVIRSSPGRMDTMSYLARQLVSRNR